MAEAKKMTVTGYIVRDGKKIKREELSLEEQKRLAITWNNAAMETAGFVRITKPAKQASNIAPPIKPCAKSAQDFCVSARNANPPVPEGTEGFA